MDLQWPETQDIVVSSMVAPQGASKGNTGENPELPRSGEQVRKPKMTLVPQGTGKSGE
jgi:hypothetical protein